MKYIIYRHEDAIYAVPENDMEEIKIADKLTEDYKGEFERIGEFMANENLNVCPIAKWYGYELAKGGSAFLKLVKRCARNADYL